MLLARDNGAEAQHLALAHRVVQPLEARGVEGHEGANGARDVEKVAAARVAVQHLRVVPLAGLEGNLLGDLAAAHVKVGRVRANVCDNGEVCGGLVSAEHEAQLIVGPREECVVARHWRHKVGHSLRFCGREGKKERGGRKVRV